MDTKEIKIDVPEGYEIDKANSTFECIKFKKKTPLDYRQILTKLREGERIYFYMDEYGNMKPSNAWGIIDSLVTICDERQARQLFALNKLMNVAAYLNETPFDWGNHSQEKWHIHYDHDNHKIVYSFNAWCKAMAVYFDSHKHAKQAVEILGEDTVKQVLGIFD